MVNCGVPQGSILGPTLFLCYINDMSDALKCRLSLYADDSALVYCGPDSLSVANFLSCELDTCHKWLVDNKLSLHLGKTECILFGPKRRLNSGVEFEIKLRDTVVSRVTFVKYLGVQLDQFLNFSNHVENLLKKANAKLGFLYRNSQFLNSYVRRLLCQSLIFSNVEYCSPAWYYRITSPVRESLNVLQRKCARFSFGWGPRTHIGDEELSNLGWIPFSKRVMFFSLVHAYKVRNGLSPAYLSDGFTFTSDVHSHNLRHSNVNFSLARCHSPTGTFSRSVVSDWNSLPKELKESRTLPVFKSALKRHLRSS